MKDWTPEEREIFEESRRLKEKARGMVLKRTNAARQRAAEAARALREAEESLKRDREIRKGEEMRIARLERDNRIRRAILAMVAAVKAENLAFSGPERFGQDVVPAFVLIDKLDTVGPSGGAVNIHATQHGFQWR